MHRTLILLDEAQHTFLLERSRALLERSRAEKVSLSEVLRRLVAEAMAKETGRDDAPARLAGIGESDGAPAGREHDRFLYGERR